MPSNENESKKQEAAEKDATVDKEACGPFVAAVQNTRMPMVFLDPRLPGNPIVFVNDSFLALTGYKREEVLGRTYHFMMGADTDPAARAQIEAAFRLSTEPGPEGERLRLRWQERGGPPVTPAGHKGFGSRLIERMLAQEIGGEVSLLTSPAGRFAKSSCRCPRSGGGHDR